MPHNAGAFLAEGTRRLQVAGIATARLDCLILLEDVLGRSRALILAHPELALSTVQYKTLETQLTAREKHIPLAYLRKKAFFYGREFVVNEHVLVPRPETEMMIDMLKTLPLVKPRIADIGTGSGCIGVTAALELPTATVFLYDIDLSALAVARMNNMALHAGAHLQLSDLLANIPQPLDIILANLPYVPEGFTVNQAAAHEPRIALFAGGDGLDAYRLLWQQLNGRTQLPQYILTESLPAQHARLVALAKPAGYIQRAAQDFIQLFELA